MPLGKASTLRLLAVVLGLLDAPATAEAARIFVSTDRGQTWKPSDVEFPEDGTANDFAVLGKLVFAATESHGMFLSKDVGRTWSPANDGFEPGEKLAAVEASGDNVFAGTHRRGVFVSKDAGKTWSPANDGLTNRTARALAVAGRRVFVGTNDGIFASDVRGGSWSRLTTGAQVNAFAVLGADIYAAGATGLSRSTDEGRTWKPIGDFGAVHNVSSDGTSVFATLYRRQVVRTDDGGATWTTADNGLPPMYTFQVLGLGNVHLAGQWTGVYLSANRGDLWTSVGPRDQAIHDLVLVDGETVLAASGLIGTLWSPPPNRERIRKSIFEEAGVAAWSRCNP